MIRQNKSKTYLFILIGLILSVFWFYPFYLVIVNSFKTKAEIFQNTLNLPKEATTANYLDAFIALDFVKSFMNSVIITVVSIVIICIFTSMAAYALSRQKGKTSSLVYFLFAICMLVPFQSIMIPLISIFGSFDLLNRTGLVIMYLGLASSLSIILYFGALRSIPVSLDEAAIIDGCNRLQVFRYIIFPMLKPTTVTVIVLNAIWFWNDYLLPSLVINKDGMYTIPLKMFYFFGEYSKQWHLALAALMIAIIPIILVYMFLQKYIIKGISDGAVK